MAMKHPPHPGRGIKENCLDPLSLNVTEAAKVLGVVECRILVTPADRLRSGPSAQRPRPD